MEWTELKDLSQLKEIVNTSVEKPVLIYKHSRRCNTSRIMLEKLERNWKEGEMSEVKPFFLDLISYRDISNAITETFNVPHESPQVLIIKKGQSVGDFSHYEIDYREIANLLKN